MSTDWIKKWELGETRFHQTKYHPQLVRFGELLTTGTILVPLCGKSLDMLYLASHGHSVIGVELSPLACRDFFIENGLTFNEKTVPDFTVFESDEITLWCGDFFKLPESVWDQVTGVYDRAALIALPPEVRTRYVSDFLNRSRRELEILLISFDYPQSVMSGPPYSVPVQEIENLYQNSKIEKLAEVSDERFGKDRGNPSLENVKFTETTYWLRVSSRSQ